MIEDGVFRVLIRGLWAKRSIEFQVGWPIHLAVLHLAHAIVHNLPRRLAQHMPPLLGLALAASSFILLAFLDQEQEQSPLADNLNSQTRASRVQHAAFRSSCWRPRSPQIAQ